MILTRNSFDYLRSIYGKLSQSQVDGLNFLVSKMKQAGFTYPEAAYGLATVYVETDKTFQPIAERGSDKYLSKYDTGKLAVRLGNTPEADGDGQLYKGRGYVQITGRANYKFFSTITGKDLIKNPDLALDAEVSTKIMTHGMLNGSFTGVGFRRKRPVSRYNLAQYIAARNIINGTDRAAEIAQHAIVFEKALRS
ncbi:putative endolysin [Acinetobacter phage vB_AbaP_Acibel007]|uniref:Putative endolysin n=1 Tax=Acinetobacter phage vB_AbaP_Acibel007 TaxID=1481187 RepID=A0A075DXC4_9CAUD|nr:endolysin [Acinetobacter phage vB_AbaP_Acibel007]AHY26819.1 putative endolysin [Acinetobacter phage vB_AbaP_Acibel007]